MDKFVAMQAFVRVVEAGTFSKAADSLAMPKPTITRLIQTLEAQLDTKLLNRTNACMATNLSISVLHGAEAAPATHETQRDRAVAADPARSRLRCLSPNGWWAAKARISDGY